MRVSFSLAPRSTRPKRERTTARELIRARVFQEVAQYNAAQGEYFQGLVQPSDAERTFNGYKLRQPRLLDPDRQVETALAAFETNGFIILVADRQVDSLDEPIELAPDLSPAVSALLGTVISDDSLWPAPAGPCVPVPHQLEKSTAVPVPAPKIARRYAITCPTW